MMLKREGCSHSGVQMRAQNAFLSINKCVGPEEARRIALSGPPWLGSPPRVKCATRHFWLLCSCCRGARLRRVSVLFAHAYAPSDDLTLSLVTSCTILCPSGVVAWGRLESGHFGGVRHRADILKTRVRFVLSASASF